MAKFAMRVGASRWVVSTLLVTGMAAVTGCDGRTKAESPAPKERAVGIAVAELTAPDAEPGIPGRPEDNSKATKAYILSLPWADNVPYASAEFVVRSGEDMARVRVVPAMGAHEVSWHASLGTGVPGGNGHFVAAIHNLDGKDIPRLGMRKSDAIGYLWIGQRPAVARGAAVYVLPRTGRVVRRRNLTISGFCAGQHPGPKVRSTEGKDCPDPFGRPLRSVRLAQLADSSSGPDQGLWVSCRGGCCEVRFQ